MRAYLMAGCWPTELEAWAAATGAALVLGWKRDGSQAPAFRDGPYLARVIQPEATKVHPVARKPSCTLEAAHVHAWVAIDREENRKVVAA